MTSQLCLNNSERPKVDIFYLLFSSGYTWLVEVLKFWEKNSAVAFNQARQEHHSLERRTSDLNCVRKVAFCYLSHSVAMNKDKIWKWHAFKGIQTNIRARRTGTNERGTLTTSKKYLRIDAVK